MLTWMRYPLKETDETVGQKLSSKIIIEICELYYKSNY